MDDLISKLSEIRSNYDCFDETEEPCYRALSEAIEALSAQPETHEKRTETHACDCISRQAAVDAMCELMHHWFGGDPKDEIREIKRELGKLPSAQSMPTKTEDLIRRGDAIEAIYRRIKQLGLEYDADVLSIRQAVREVPSTQPSGKDPIEREAVVDILHDAMPGCSESEENLIGEIVCKVDLLPSAQAEERTEERTETHACDCISRQAAIDALIKWYGCEPTDIGSFENIIEKLPPAQPYTEDEIQKIQDLEQAQLDKMYELGKQAAQAEPHEIGYSECANSTLKMWIDNVLTDGEYSHIMDKLNAYWAERRADGF